MKQGTGSVLYGCHSVIHSICTVAAWVKLNKEMPTPWQLVCILLHDVGHWGTNYLDNIKEKQDHWKLGAGIAERLFGLKGYYLIAGHCVYSDIPRNQLYYADKLAMKLAPRWYMLWCGIAEPKLHAAERARGMTLGQAVEDWRRWVNHNIESGEYRGNHEMYLERKQEIEFREPLYQTTGEQADGRINGKNSTSFRW